MGTTFTPDTREMTPEGWRITCPGCEADGRPDPYPIRSTREAAVALSVETGNDCPVCSEHGSLYPVPLFVEPSYGHGIDRIDTPHFSLSGSETALAVLGVARADRDMGEMPAREMVARADRALPRVVGDADTLRRIKALRVLARDTLRAGLSGVCWG